MRNKSFFLTILALLFFLDPVLSQARPFVPNDFKVPDTLETPYFRVRMLTVNDVVKDYDAVMTSVEHLQKMYASTTWPTKELTFEQDLIDLGWHQKEFQRRRSFAYTIVSLDESEVIGCLYINPTTKDDYDANISMWVRTSVLDKGLDPILFNTVKQWIQKDWPFKKVAYPGREITWEVWRSAKKDIDALTSSPGNFKLVFENENVRVLEYTLKPGQKDSPHTHPAKSSYVVSGGKLKVYLENGETIIADEKTGTASWMNAVGKHFVENIGNTTVKIVLTEVKTAR